ncbi:MAG TPA: hypothetical protein VM536_06465 [Chloroflexia bacterium]|nr:hypothetical protein [Chloroflexia bacterium]
MERVWYRRDREAVLAALRRGARPDMATTMACGPLDELVALHEELGIPAALDGVAVARRRAGVSDGLLLRTLATLPFLQDPALSAAAGALFREPAILLQLGWAPAQIRGGANRRHRHPAGRQPGSLPCHPDTLRDTLRRVAEGGWAQVQRAGVQALYARHLVRGQVYAIDGSGLGPDRRVVTLVCVSGERPTIVAWRLLTGSASEQGKAAAVTRALVEQALALGGPGGIRLLLAAALYADGPLLAWLKCVHGIDALVRLPADRLLYADLQGLARTPAAPWAAHQYVRTIQGHKQVRRVAVTSAGDLTSWDSFLEAAGGYGAPDATLWACLIREVAPTSQPVEEASALVSTRPWADGRAALHAYRPRWHIENDGYRELKEGWGLEEQHWGRDEAALRGRLALTCLAFNTAQVYRSRAGARLATVAIRRLRQQHRAALGAAPAVLYVDGCYAVLALEDLLAALGSPVRESLLPASDQAAEPRPPP